MPIYEYECKNCHHHYDLMQKITESPVTQCPQCMENSAVRLVSAAGFQLKGTGWYATDFKTKPPKTETKTTTESSTTEKKPASSSALESEKK